MTDAIECAVCGDEDCRPYPKDGGTYWLCEKCFLKRLVK